MQVSNAHVEFATRFLAIETGLWIGELRLLYWRPMDQASSTTHVCALGLNLRDPVLSRNGTSACRIAWAPRTPT